MNLKTNAAIALIAFVLGLYAGNILWNKPNQQILVKQDEHKSGVIKREISRKADGSEHVDEVEKYISDNKQYVSIIQPAKKHTIGYIPMYDFKSSRIIHSGFYSYSFIDGISAGLYLSPIEQKAGLVLSVSF